MSRRREPSIILNSVSGKKRELLFPLRWRGSARKEISYALCRTSKRGDATLGGGRTKLRAALLPRLLMEGKEEATLLPGQGLKHVTGKGERPENLLYELFGKKGERARC